MKFDKTFPQGFVFSFLAATILIASDKPCSAETNDVATPTVAATVEVHPSREKDPGLRRSTYTPRVYPVDERGFSPEDKALAKAYACEDMVTNDDEGSLNPFVLKVISGYPLDGSY